MPGGEELSGVATIATANTGETKQQKWERKLNERGLKVSELGQEEKDERKNHLEKWTKNENWGRIIEDLDVVASASELVRMRISVDWVSKELMESVLEYDSKNIVEETKRLYKTAIDKEYIGIGLIHVYYPKDDDKPGESHVLAGYSHIGVRELEDGTRVLESPLVPFDDYYFANRRVAEEMGLDPDRMLDRTRAPGFIKEKFALQVAENFKGIGMGELLTNMGSYIGASVFGATERWFTTDATNNEKGSYYVNQFGAEMRTIGNTSQGVKEVPVLKISPDLDSYDFQPYIH